MLSSRPVEYLSAASRETLVDVAKDEKVLDDAFVSTFTTFRSVGGDDSSTLKDEAVVQMRIEIAKALDRLEKIVIKVLKERKQAEASAMTWIKIGGAVIVFLVIAAAIAPFVTNQQFFTSLFSTLSVGGLLLLLYSPVRETLAIANDRSNLILMVNGFRLQFAAASSVEELQGLASELTAALQLQVGGATE